MNLYHSEGQVLITSQANGRKFVKVCLRDTKLFSPRLEIETSYSEELIALILDVKGAAWLCDEIARDEDLNYLGKLLENDLRAYFNFEDFAGKRILDFGCGSGASSIWLARLFPQCEIVGIELMDDLLSIANGRLEYYGFQKVKFLKSPSGTEIPHDLGAFDLIVMSAVYEHLLPNERKVIMSKLWQVLPDGGFLFFDQTPNRFFPMESHTTMLPLINFLPDKLTLFAARKFSKRTKGDESWETLLRKGIRGATAAEIRKNLSDNETKALMLKPNRTGLSDGVDLWFQSANLKRLYAIKHTMRVALKAINFLTGVAVVPNLALAFQKER